MKFKKIVLVCCLAVTATLVGCGSDSSMKGSIDEMEPMKETKQEIVEEPKEEADTDEVTTQEETSGDIPAQEDNEDTTGNANADALMAYQEILNAAPAVDGAPEQFDDVTFDYDQNVAMFGNHIDMFAIVDINQDGISELLTLSTVNFRWAPISVYTYVDGNAVLLKNPLDPEAHGTFEHCSVTNGSNVAYICGSNHIHSVWKGTNPMDEEVEENCAFVLDGNTLTLTDCTVGESGNTIYFYDVAKPNTTENVNAIVQ